jgi:hypothetical protein
MFRNNNQFGGNLEQLANRIRELISQPERQVSTIPDGTEANIRTAVATITELNTLSKRVNEELAKQRVKINSMLGRLRNSDLARIREQPFNLPPFPTQDTTTPFITALEGLANALDTFHSAPNNRGNVAPLTNYITQVALPDGAQRGELLIEIVDSMLSSVITTDNGAQRKAVIEALNTKFGAANVATVVNNYDRGNQPGAPGGQAPPTIPAQQQQAPPARPVQQQQAPPTIPAQQQQQAPPARPVQQQQAPPARPAGQQGGSNIIKLNLKNLL